MEIKTNHIFRPVRCTEEMLETLAPIEGYVVFTTDTHKIFVCVNGQYEMMGGSSGVYYGNRPLTDDEKYGDQVFFSFAPSQIDGNALPGIDDLILNIPDGGFYRVLEVSEIEIQTQRIAISGGGGGGTGGGGGNANEGSLVIEYITPQNSSTITGVDYYIEYRITAKDSAGDNIATPGTATWRVNGHEITEEVYAGRDNSFKVDQYLDASLSTNKITLVVSMDTGGYNNTIVSKTWYVKAVALSLQWNRDYNTNNYISSDTFTLNWIPSGGIDCTTHLSFYDAYGIKVKDYNKVVLAKDTGRTVYSDPINSLDYGAYTCEMYLSAEVNGETYRTESIKNEITFIKDGTSTILTVPFYKKVATQYDTLNIPFMVYDPDQDSCGVNFYVNDELVGGDTYDRNIHYWPYTLTEYGSVKLSIQTNNKDARRDFELIVNKIDLDVSPPKAIFELKANNFSSGNEIRNWEDNGVTLTFSDNFDWENGGLQFDEKEDGSIEKYICVRQGTRMTVNYNLFDDNQNVAANGKNFKVCFKAVNCYDYEAPVLECYEELTKTGIKLDAQKAVFSTVGNENFTTQYYENSYIELETEIWPDVKDIDANLPGDRFLMFWVDGIPAGVKTFEYGNSKTFSHLNPVPITIGSDLCDVYIYVMKAYDRKLETNEHLDNFIMDAPSTEEMLSRYSRNNITDNNGQISPEKLVQNNPNCHAYIYEMPAMTTSKKDKVGGCNYIELFGSYNTLDNPYYKAINTDSDITTKGEKDGKGAQVYVQGTSSAAYGVAAFNLRTKFQEGFIDKNGEKVSKWQVNDDAIPVKLSCTKVNVASCENANNVVNQEWYNKFQPYHDAHRRKSEEDGKKYRDTMEFNSGVVFVKDNNTKSDYYLNGKPDRAQYLESNVFLDTKLNDGTKYVDKPFYKQYAIGNMGNDKKNSEVFHDETNSKACCVEVTDNQTAEQMMTVKVDNATVWIDDDDMPFEFRYPDGNDEASDELKQGFVDFVNWMAENNPNAWTGDELPEPESFEVYTYKGFDPPGYEGKPNPTGITLKGQKESKYAGTYTHDTYEYRMAKMLEHCEEHLVMDSVVFHYLFIQRHTMVDNVAKNTFWSSEDLIHWDLTKDYDNDTADGNNNTGYLTYSYGLECKDKTYDEETGEGSDVFNAGDSVWFTFIHGLSEAQKYLHQELQKKGAWNAKEYLDEFKRHQDAIPERCWIEDYFRKYIRPRRLGLDQNTYLERLEGGKKTHQRTQYENYQEFYLNSKYLAGPVFTQGASIDLRLNKQPGEGTVWDVNNIIPISFYIDCYASGLIGGVSHQSPRLKRKEVYDIPVGTLISTANDSTCYLYGASMVQTLAGLPNVYPTYATLNVASKLRELELGSDNEGYYNSNLEAVSIDTISTLQKVLIQNSGTKDLNGLSLTSAYQLDELRINGSTIPTLTLATGGVVETLYLNALTSLNLTDLIKLKDIHLDDGIYNSMSVLSVKNCPAMDPYTYEMVLRAPITNYVLTDFNWEITDVEDLSTDENGNVLGIKVLDKLMAVRPGATTHAASLSGHILVNVNAKIDEFEIYKKYCRTYPNVIIEYSEAVSDLNSAVEIVFMGNDSADAEIHYRVLGSGEATGDSIGKLISEDGPTGVAITNPNREPTAETVYIFRNLWKLKGDTSGKQYFIEDDINGDQASDTLISFNSIIPTEDMTFIPLFYEQIRTHEVKFYDYFGELIESKDVPYGVTYREAGGTLTNFYYLDSSELEANRRYGFKGWTTVKYDAGQGRDLEYIDVNTYIIKGPINLYPYYEVENVYDVATNPDYFEVRDNGIILKEEYKDTLEGKVTIPDFANATSIGREGFRNASKITHIYFLKNSSNYDTVGERGFQGCSSLIKVELSSSIETIDNYGFRDCYALESINLNNIKIIGDYGLAGGTTTKMTYIISELPEGLVEIGENAFYNGGDNITLTKLPNSLERILGTAFAWCNNVKITNFGSDGTGSKLKYIGERAFYQTGSGSTGPVVNSIVIHNSVSEIGRNAFSLAYDNLENVYFTKGESEYSLTPADMGFDTSKVTVGFNYDPNGGIV